MLRWGERGEVGAKEGAKGEGKRARALMAASLLDALLIPRQEYQKYLTGNVTKCHVGKCQRGRTGGRPPTSPLRGNKHASAVERQPFISRAPSLRFMVATRFHGNGGRENGPGSCRRPPSPAIVAPPPYAISLPNRPKTRRGSQHLHMKAA